MGQVETESAVMMNCADYFNPGMLGLTLGREKKTLGVDKNAALVADATTSCPLQAGYVTERAFTALSMPCHLWSVTRCTRHNSTKRRPSSPQQPSGWCVLSTSTCIRRHATHFSIKCVLRSTCNHAWKDLGRTHACMHMHLLHTEHNSHRTAQPH